MTASPDTLKKTPLHALHVELGAKMVPFAGYDMPVSFPLGVLGEHRHTRAKAGLFDVSHMGQARLLGPDHETTARTFETLVPGNIVGLAPGAMRYTLLLNDQGGIRDDLMVTRPDAEDGVLFLVVNAACKDADFAHIEASLPATISLQRLPDRALLALQGPAASAVLEHVVGNVAQMGFMTSRHADWKGSDLIVSRCGYTGEDGFEISVPEEAAERLARALLSEPDVEPIGLGARDSLRLEAGLCLYGHDIDQQTTPIEAALAWTMPKRRREEGGFPGAETILGQLEAGPMRLRVGIRPQGKAPAREGTVIVDTTGAEIGKITSGGFGPTVEGPVAMGYVDAAHAAEGTDVGLVVRGRTMSAVIAAMPFTPNRYFRGNK